VGPDQAADVERTLLLISEARERAERAARRLRRENGVAVGEELLRHDLAAQQTGECLERTGSDVRLGRAGRP
jgi:hypothetical protein